MATLLAVDPSVRSPGVALFRDSVLVKCERLRITDHPQLTMGERWDYVSYRICMWCEGLPETIVYERPQVYTTGKSKGDPNDLLGLAAIGAAVAGRFHETCNRILTPTPAEWCGQIPKKTTGSAKTSPRARRILSRLSEEEAKLVPDQHDTIDAVGLGLWALGRLGLKRVYIRN